MNHMIHTWTELQLSICYQSDLSFWSSHIHTDCVLPSKRTDEIAFLQEKFSFTFNKFGF